MAKATILTAEEPITIAEAKTWLKLDQANTEEDDLLTVCIQAAREGAERYTARTYAKVTVIAEVTGTKDLLPFCPILEVLEVKDKDGNVLDPGAYTAHLNTGPDQSQCTIEADAALYPLSVKYVGGRTSETIPGEVKLALFNAVGSFYRNREEDMDLPVGSKAKLATHRRLTWF